MYYFYVIFLYKLIYTDRSEKSYQLADDGLAELVRGRLDVIHMKMAQLDQNWLAQTQQLQLGAGRQLSGSGESSYRCVTIVNS